MQRRLLIVVLAVALLIPHSALTWNGRGHMTIAAITYQQLNETIQAKVDTLLGQHPAFAVLSDGIPAGSPALEAQAETISETPRCATVALFVRRFRLSL